VWAGGGQRVSVVHGLSIRPAGRAPVRRTHPQLHRTARDDVAHVAPRLTLLDARASRLTADSSGSLSVRRRGRSVRINDSIVGGA